MILSHLIIMLIALGAVFYRIVITGRLGRGFIYFWLLYIAYAVVFSIIVPSIVANWNNELAAKAFPEAICVLPCIIMGWFPAAILTGIAYCYLSIKKCCADKNKKSANQQ
jgi:hypothetical protein